MKSSKERFTGALIRVGDGVGCVHPWEVFGDEPLETHLAELAAGRQTRLVANALHCAELDGKARAAGVSLFDGENV